MVEYSDQFVLPGFLRWLLGNRTRHVQQIRFPAAGPHAIETRHTDLFVQFPNLKTLHFPEEAGLTDAHLNCLTALPRLETLTVNYIPLSEKTLATIASLSKLKRLRLAHAELSDDDLKHLMPLTRLERLSLADNPFGDAGLQSLGRCEKLTALHLDGTNITNQAIERLTRFRRLRYLTLERTAVTLNRATIEKKLPQLKTEH